MPKLKAVNNTGNEIKTEAEEVSKELKRESVIFTGSGTVWAGKINGDRPLCRFNKNHLLITDDPVVIKYLRAQLDKDGKRIYKELQNTVDDLERFVENPSLWLYNKQKPQKLSPQLAEYEELLRSR